MHLMKEEAQTSKTLYTMSQEKPHVKSEEPTQAEPQDLLPEALHACVL